MPWEIKKIVLPQHTDHAGVMWHGSYLNLMEEGRISALNNVGFPYDKLSCAGFELPVISIDIKYKLALKHGEEVLIKTWFLPRVGVKLPCKVLFEKIGGIKSAESLVNLVVIQNIEGHHRLVKDWPLNIKQLVASLQKGPC